MNSKQSWYAFVIFIGMGLFGCSGNDKPGPATIPTDLNKPLPKLAAPSGGDSPTRKNPAEKAE